MGRRTPFGPVLRAAFVAIVIGSVLVAAGALARAEQPVTPSGPHDVQPLTTIVYTGNGSAEGGNTPGPWTCGSFQDDPNINPDPGQTGYLFILTNPGAGPWNLTITFNPGGQQVVPGVQQGNGSIHFIVYADQGAVITAASASGGTSDSNLTMSHCTQGALVTTTSSLAEETTTTTVVSTSTSGVSESSVPASVLGETVTVAPAATSAQLAFTGGIQWGLVAGGIALMIAGASLVVAARRPAPRRSG